MSVTFLCVLAQDDDQHVLEWSCVGASCFRYVCVRYFCRYSLKIIAQGSSGGTSVRGSSVLLVSEDPLSWQWPRRFWSQHRQRRSCVRYVCVGYFCRVLWSTGRVSEYLAGGSSARVLSRILRGRSVRRFLCADNSCDKKKAPKIPVYERPLMADKHMCRCSDDDVYMVI